MTNTARPKRSKTNMWYAYMRVSRLHFEFESVPGSRLGDAQCQRSRSQCWTCTHTDCTIRLEQHLPETMMRCHAPRHVDRCRLRETPTRTNCGTFSSSRRKADTCSAAFSHGFVRSQDGTKGADRKSPTIALIWRALNANEPLESHFWDNVPICARKSLRTPSVPTHDAK